MYDAILFMFDAFNKGFKKKITREIEYIVVQFNLDIAQSLIFIAWKDIQPKILKSSKYRIYSQYYIRVPTPTISPSIPGYLRHFSSIISWITDYQAPLLIMRSAASLYHAS